MKVPDWEIGGVHQYGRANRAVNGIDDGPIQQQSARGCGGSQVQIGVTNSVLRGWLGGGGVRRRLPRALECRDRIRELLLEVRVEGLGLVEFVPYRLARGLEVAEHGLLERRDLVHRDIVEQALGAGVDRDDLIDDVLRNVLGLLE